MVVFDEPTHGLDPLWTQRFRDIVAGMRRPSRTMLIASHNLDELERVSDRVAILNQGRLQRVVTAGAAHTGGVYRLVLAVPHAGLTAAFADAVPVEGRAAEFRVEGDIAGLNHGLGRLIEAGAVVTAFYPEQSRLESEFRAAVEDKL